jgi:dihydroneopterin aldolase
MNYALVLEKLTIPVRLGCSEEERSLPQMVIINLKIFFSEKPKECESDNLNDAICYDKLSKSIQKFCADKTFNLIESLGYQIYQLLKQQLPEKIKFSLQVIKNPPIPNLNNCIFEISC